MTMNLFIHGLFNRSRDNVVSIESWLQAGQLRGQSSSPSRVKNFLFPVSSRPALGSTQPSIQRVSGTLSSGVKRPGREADHSTSS
jgi:hypothetical protein